MSGLILAQLSFVLHKFYIQIRRYNADHAIFRWLSTVLLVRSRTQPEEKDLARFTQSDRITLDLAA